MEHEEYSGDRAVKILKKRTSRKAMNCSDWSRLPPELWCTVLANLPLAEYVRCSAVCKLWHSIIIDDKVCSPKPEAPWLLLPGLYGRRGIIRKLFTINACKVRSISMPELSNSKVIGSSNGWLLTVDLTDASSRAFNPVTRAQINFPPARTLPGVAGRVGSYITRTGNVVRQVNIAAGLARDISKATVSWSSSGCCSTVALLYGRKVAFAGAGDAVWSGVRLPRSVNADGGVLDIKFHKGMLYAVESRGLVVCIDLQINAVVSKTGANVQVPVVGRYLVSTGYGLLQLCRIQDHGFRVYRLDDGQITARWESVGSLDGHKLVISFDASGLSKVHKTCVHQLAGCSWPWVGISAGSMR